MNRARRILLFANAIANGSTALLGPIYAIYVEKIGGGILEVAGSYTVYCLAYGILMLVFGRWEDKFKETEYFLAAGVIISAIGFAGYLTASNILHLVIIQGILGVAFALMTPAQDALYTKHLDRGKFGTEWGTWEAVFWITEGVGAFLGGMIANFVGFQALFMVMMSISFLTGLYILFLPRKIL